MVRRAKGRPGRHFLYVSNSRLQAYVERADDRLWLNILRSTQATIPWLVQINLSNLLGRPLGSRPKTVQVHAAEESIRGHFPVGDLVSGEEGQWISGRVAMDFAPVPDGQTVLFCGYAGPLIVVIFASSESMTFRMSSTGVTGSYFRPISPVNISDPRSATFGSDLRAAAAVICDAPEPVRFLAEVAGRGALPGDGEQREFLVVRPLYVESASRPDNSAHVPVQGTVRWFNADRGWGLIYPDDGTDAVLFRSSESALSGSQTVAAGQRVEFRITNGSAGIEATGVRRVAAGPAPELSRSPVANAGQPPEQAEGGWMIGGYWILRLLANGTMGVVYLAQDSAGNLVAIKLIRPEYATDPEFRRGFEAEATSARKVRSANLARVLASGTAGGQPYLVTEYVAGPTLAEHGPVADVAEVAAGIAAGLAAIHKAGVIHRDLAPSNVILSPSGPVIIDFGLARSRRDTKDLSQAERLAGTLYYAAPEQISDARVMSASDIFSWAGVIVFAATGHPPFGGEGIPMLRVTENIRNGTPSLGDIPGDVRTLLAAALNKDPRQRPAAKQLVMALAGQARSGTGSREDRAPVRRRPYGRLSPRAKAGAVVAGVVVVAVAAFGIPRALSPSSPSSPGSAGIPSGPATSIMSGRRIVLPSGYRVSGVAVGPQTHAVAILGISGPQTDTLFVWQPTEPNKLERMQISASSNSNSVNPAFDPRNSNLIAVGDSSGIEIWNWVTQKKQPLFIKDPGGFSVSQIAYTSDGSAIVEADQNGGIYQLNASDGSLENSFSGDNGTASGLSISRSGSVVAVANADGGIDVWESPGDQASQGNSTAVAVAISPSGRFMALGENETGPEVQDLSARDPLKNLTENVMSADEVAFSPDGATLASGSNTGYIYLWNLTTDRAISVPCSVSTWDGLVFSPDGKTLAAFDANGPVYLYNVNY
jgi:serine/threonine protein kinase/cold shock CspA family protein